MSRTESGFLARRDVGSLGEFTGAGTAVELINRFLGGMLLSGDMEDSVRPGLSRKPGPLTVNLHLA